jgi:hypothetical protein
LRQRGPAKSRDQTQGSNKDCAAFQQGMFLDKYSTAVFRAFMPNSRQPFTTPRADEGH